jgi:hypothetical protein
VGEGAMQNIRRLRALAVVEEFKSNDLGHDDANPVIWAAWMRRADGGEKPNLIGKIKDKLIRSARKSFRF